MGPPLVRKIALLLIGKPNNIAYIDALLKGSMCSRQDVCFDNYGFADKLLKVVKENLSYKSLSQDVKHIFPVQHICDHKTLSEIMAMLLLFRYANY